MARNRENLVRRAVHGRPLVERVEAADRPSGTQPPANIENRGGRPRGQTNEDVTRLRPVHNTVDVQLHLTPVGPPRPCNSRPNRHVAIEERQHASPRMSCRGWERVCRGRA